MAHSYEQWEYVRALYERGLTMQEIVDREDIQIKNRSQISRRAKKEEWFRIPEKQHAVEKEIKAKQDLAEIKATKATEKATDIKAHDVIVAEKLAAAEYFTKSAILNQRKANALLEEAETMVELAQHSGLTARNKQTVLGKQPDTAIQINNSQPSLDVSLLSIETQLEIARAIRR